jgi:hypothetical protein
MGHGKENKAIIREFRLLKWLFGTILLWQIFALYANLPQWSSFYKIINESDAGTWLKIMGIFKVLVFGVVPLASVSLGIVFLKNGHRPKTYYLSVRGMGLVLIWTYLILFLDNVTNSVGFGGGMDMVMSLLLQNGYRYMPFLLMGALLWMVSGSIKDWGLMKKDHELTV